jgi:hypothetical protein
VKKYRFIKSLLTLSLLMIVLKVLAPEVKDIIIIVSEPVQPYERLIRAVVHVESLGDTMAYNIEEEAAGAFQIRPIRLQDYNLRTKKDYKLKDRYNYKISKEIFLYYAKQIGFSDYETIAKNWNGSGKETLKYWEKIKSHL